MVGRQTHPVKCLPWGLKDPESDLQKPHNNRAQVVLAWGCSVEKWKQRDCGTHWTASLALLRNFRPARNPVSRKHSGWHFKGNS